MTCRICGCETPKGAKLCKDCAAARKRAFAATVTQPLLLAAAGAPSVNHPRFAPRPTKPKSTAPARNAAAKTTAARPEPASAGPSVALKTRPIDRSHASPAISPLVPPPAPQRQSVTPLRTPEPRRSMMRWLTIVAGAGFVVVLLAIMIVLRRGSTTEAPEDTTSRAPATTAAPMTPAATAATGPVVAETAPSQGSPSEAEAALPPVKPATLKAKRKAVPAENASKTPAPEVNPAIVAEPTPRNVVAPQRVIDTVRTDPLQSLNDALTRCAREDMLNRPGCEQRARSQSCGNWWGQVPQCPIGPATDHGQ
jgi:hypothetical protein